MKRALSVVITVVLALACMAGSLVLFSGCDDNNPFKIDPNRTQLYIGVKDDGIGKDWVYDAITQFEAEYPKIQVIPKFEDTLYEEKNVKTTMPTAKESVYVLSSLDIYTSWLTKNADGSYSSPYLLNLYDIFNEDPEGEEKSILDRMDQEERAHLTSTDANGNPAIYTLPYYETYWGAIYDHKLFTAEGLYNLDGYVGIDCEDGTPDDTYGPDGVANTYDDGLPATWEDMKILMDVMVSKGITPFTWTYNYYTYQTQFLNSIFAMYEGKEDFLRRYTMTGADDDPAIGEIDYTNAYKLADQEGLRAAVTVAKHIMSNDQYYSKNATYSTQSHTAAQDEFITSVKAPGAKPIGFLLESGWWENEAKGTFASMAAMYGEEYAYGNREFKWLPFPKFLGSPDIKDQTNTKTTMYSGVGTGGAGWLISANTPAEILPIAKDFVKFCNSERMSARFTEITGICKPLSYSMTDEQKANMTTYTRTIYENVHNPEVEKIRARTRNPLIVNAASYFTDYSFRAVILKGTNRQSSEKNPFDTFRNYPELTVDQYLEGIKAVYNQKEWNDKLSQWYYLFND